jgi:hypothetical protein
MRKVLLMLDLQDRIERVHCIGQDWAIVENDSYDYILCHGDRNKYYEINLGFSQIEYNQEIVTNLSIWLSSESSNRTMAKYNKYHKKFSEV